MAEAEIAGEATQQRPARCQGNPEEDEIEEGIVESRQAGRGQERKDADRQGGGKSWQIARNAHIHSGSQSRISIRSENDTTGAQAGLKHAMAIDSLAPI